MEDSILRDTYSVLSNHRKESNDFENFQRLLFKAINGKNPGSGDSLSFCKEEEIRSEKRTMIVGDLYSLKERMPKKHNRQKDFSNLSEIPIIVARYDGMDWLVDGGNRINYWYGCGDNSKLLKVNYHIFD